MTKRKPTTRLEPTLAEQQLKTARRESPLEATFMHWWCILKPQGVLDPEREISLIPGSRARCDFVWQASRVVVEIDGGQHKPGGGRHNTDVDRWKINELTALGYRVFRYSGEMLKADPQRVINQVVAAVWGLKGGFK